MENLFALIETRARLTPERPAVAGLNGFRLSYVELAAQIRSLAASLTVAHVQRGDRVALVLPNGPDAAIAFLGVSSIATAAPLNPAYSHDEFEFYLRDLQARAVIADTGAVPALGSAAAALGIRVLPYPLPTASTASGSKADPTLNWATADDVALVLHTSGTTSRPKIVPLTHRNLLASARNVTCGLELTETDRCLNVMPLFHIHGLVAAVLASLAAGGSVVCTPGFNAGAFLGWCREFTPSWYTAVPTMHQAILEQLRSRGGQRDTASLRFARSCSSALPPQLMASLEATLGIPVIEAYGMTEAAHQLASNPVPPGPRKPGSVGPAAGTALAVMNETGQLLPPGETGEIVVRGENVTPGYASSAEANARAFTDGWFRTGDQGYLDTEGYLFLTGRIKEIINRGGEKISPREIDEALLDHPGVAQAVAFALPHPTLGEDLAVAIVPRPGCALTEGEIREYAFGRLAAFRVPSAIVIVDSIPKGPTGKLQRIGLAEKLRAQLAATYVPPRDAIEALVADIWQEVLGHDRLGIHENFFAAGGDSLRGTRVIARVNELFGTDLPVTTAFRHPTIDQFATAVRHAADPRRLADITRTLQEMESLSDAEIDGLLAAESERRAGHPPARKS